MTAAKIFQFISNVILGLGIFLAVLLLVNRFLGPKSAKIYIVSSGSMSPQIQTGSLVLSLPQTSYHVGDIVTFYSDASKKTTVTHRIVALNGGEIKTAGDANNQPETSLTPVSQIVGRVIFAIPWVGFLAGFAKTPRGFILLVIVPATIIIYEEIKNMAKEIKPRLPKVAAINPIYPLAIILPLVGAGLIYTSFSNSFFSDLVTSPGNSVTILAPTPTPTPLPFVAPQSEVGPTPTDAPTDASPTP